MRVGWAISDLGAATLKDLTAEFIASNGEPRVVPTARAYRDDLRQFCDMVASGGVTTLTDLWKPRDRADEPRGR